METIILLSTTWKIIGWACFAAFVILCLCIVVVHASHTIDYDEREAIEQDKKEN